MSLIHASLLGDSEHTLRLLCPGGAAAPGRLSSSAFQLLPSPGPQQGSERGSHPSPSTWLPLLTLLVYSLPNGSSRLSVATWGPEMNSAPSAAPGTLCPVTSEKSFHLWWRASLFPELLGDKSGCRAPTPFTHVSAGEVVGDTNVHKWAGEHRHHR